MMAQAVFYTIPYSLLDAKGSISEYKGHGVNILIDDLQFTIANVVNYANSVNADFIFSLSGDLLNNPVFETLFEKLYSLFTVSAFACDPTIDLPILITKPRIEHHNRLERLKSYFEGQGEHLNMITSGISTNVQNKILFLSAAELEVFSAEQLAAYYKMDIEQVVYLPECIVNENREAVLQVNFPTANKAADLLFNKVTIARQLAVSQHQKWLWQNRAQLYLSFLTLSKEIGEGEYYGIKNWYHNEYEVLPLWYKQFGHIIKVLSGKRSFKSLFDKN